MTYALNLAEDSRILSACVVLPNGNYDGMPIVEELPEGNIFEYRYVVEENAETGELTWEYVHDPLPEPEQPDPEPTQEERIEALEKQNADLKSENTMLTAQVSALSDQMDFYEECIVEMAEVVYA